MSGTLDYKATIYYSAAPGEEADRLGNALLDAASDALGCSDAPEHTCPHFQVASIRPVSGSRTWAIRCALRDLWDAVRRGEV